MLANAASPKGGKEFLPIFTRRWICLKMRLKTRLRARQASVRRSLPESWPKLLPSLIKDENGQAVTEYILILSASIFAASTIARTILKGLDQGILNLGGQLEKDLKTGRAPLDTWQN